jgi:hypothetical protein
MSKEGKMPVRLCKYSRTTKTNLMQLHCTTILLTFAAYENSHPYIHYLYACLVAYSLR